MQWEFLIVNASLTLPHYYVIHGLTIKYLHRVGYARESAGTAEQSHVNSGNLQIYYQQINYSQERALKGIILIPKTQLSVN